MPLTNMKSSTPVVPDVAAGGSLMGERSEYPWGLQITLEEAQLAALGLGELPKVGGTFTLSARAMVYSTRMDPNAREGQGRSLTLQITDLELHDDAEKTDEQRAARIYTVPIASGNGK